MATRWHGMHFPCASLSPDRGRLLVGLFRSSEETPVWCRNFCRWEASRHRRERSAIGRLSCCLSSRPRANLRQGIDEAMKRLWPYLYLSIATVIFLCNTGLIRQHYGKTNVDWIFVTISLLITALFPSMAASSVYRRAIIDPPRASFSRGFAGSWRTDPWQCLLLMTVWTWAWFLGSLFTLPHANHQGVMMVGWKGAMAIGLLFGGAIARRKYRRKVG
jgi:hypothetical protein